MTSFRTLLFLLSWSISNAGFADFAYDTNLIACQHGFSSCDTTKLTEEHRQAVDDVQILLDPELKKQKNLAKTSKSDNYSARVTTQQNGTYSSSCAENGSCYGDISSNTGSPKTVEVKGYHRKDGTYVRGHYRSKPSK